MASAVGDGGPGGTDWIRQGRGDQHAADAVGRARHAARRRRRVSGRRARSICASAGSTTGAMPAAFTSAAIPRSKSSTGSRHVCDGPFIRRPRPGRPDRGRHATGRATERRHSRAGRGAADASRRGAARGRGSRDRSSGSNRPATVGRLPGLGTPAGLRGASARPREDGPARPAVHPTSARDHGRHDRRFSEQRHDVSQRLLARAGASVRPRPLPSGPDAVGPVRPSWHRARLLRHSLAHERVHPRVQPSVLRRHRRRWAATQIAGVPAGHVHAAPSGANSAGAAPRKVTVVEGDTVEANFNVARGGS